MSSSTHAIKWINNRAYRHTITALFIGNPASRAAQQLAEILGSYGQLSLTIHPRSKLVTACTPYDIYILDANTLRDIPNTLAYILNRQPRARILVIQDNDTWQVTRAAFRAGALDVIRTPNSVSTMQKTLQRALAQQLPQAQVAGV